jgi:hypothetical protein
MNVFQNKEISELILSREKRIECFRVFMRWLREHPDEELAQRLQRKGKRKINKRNNHNMPADYFFYESYLVGTPQCSMPTNRSSRKKFSPVGTSLRGMLSNYSPYRMPFTVGTALGSNNNL